MLLFSFNFIHIDFDCLQPLFIKVITSHKFCIINFLLEIFDFQVHFLTTDSDFDYCQLSSDM